MKICCCSRSYARALRSGALTQLEWIDRCVELGFDGVDFAAAHFPRTDPDYLAQLKKLCVDRGMTVAAVSADIPFGEGDVDDHVERLRASIDAADALAAPLVRFSCGAASGSPAIAWRELIRGLKVATMTAKERNVTLALEPRESSLVGSDVDIKRVLKECDSAWLRLALPLARYGADVGQSAASSLGDVVIAIEDGTGSGAGLRAAHAAGFIGFVSLESAGHDEDRALRSVYDVARASVWPTRP